MIQVNLIQNQKLNGSSYRMVNLTCGNKTAEIMTVTGNSNYVTVICKNASHKTWRGTGREFPDLQKAAESYKSSEMKAMIEAVASGNI